MGNNIEFLDSIKAYLNKSFSMKDLGEAAYILGIKIYRDRSRRLMIFSKNAHLAHDFERVQNRSAKKEFLAVLQGVSIE